MMEAVVLSEAFRHLIFCQTTGHNAPEYNNLIIHRNDYVKYDQELVGKI